MEFADSQRAVENRETWRELVRKSSMVPPTILTGYGKVKCEVINVSVVGIYEHNSNK